MARAGRSYPNVPVVVRGSLQDPSDFGSRTRTVVVTSQPARAQTAVPPVAILRSTLQDPPVLTTRPPVVIAAQPDRRWFAAKPPRVLKGSVPPPAPVTGTGLLLAGFI